MKKYLILCGMAFLLSPFLNAAEAVVESRACHEAALVSAGANGGTGDQYAEDYMNAYNACEAYIEQEETIEP